jgi:hypothetical protein
MPVRIIGIGWESIQDSVNERIVEVVPDHEILDFPRHRHELSFPFCMKKMQPVFFFTETVIDYINGVD